jgi:hypothetical protein
MRASLSPVGRRSYLPSCRNKRLPPSRCKLKISVSSLMWLAKNGNSKSSCICLFVTFQTALVAIRRHLEWIVGIFLTCVCGWKTTRKERVVHHKTKKSVWKAQHLFCFRGRFIFKERAQKARPFRDILRDSTRSAMYRESPHGTELGRPTGPDLQTDVLTCATGFISRSSWRELQCW